MKEPHALDLAQEQNLGVVLTRVIPSQETYYQHISAFPDDLEWTANIPSFEQIEASTVAEVLEYLGKVEADLNARGIETVEVKVLRGFPAEAIINLAKEPPDNLVTMTNHGRAGLGRRVPGSVANRAVQQSEDPVLLVRATGDDT